MSNKPMISIVTPVYNGQEYIENCILSLKNQTFQDFEHIIIDGGSIDDTIKIAEKYLGSYNLKIFSQKDNGMYDAILKGFEKSSGEIFAWLNSDDMYFPWTLKVVSEIFDNFDINWCTGHPGFFNQDGVYRLLEILPLYNRKLIRKGLYDGRYMYHIQQESTFWTRELWDKSDKQIFEKFIVAGDFQLWREFSKYANLYSVNSPLAGFRIRKGQLSQVRREEYYLEVGKLNSFQKLIVKLKIFKLYQKMSSIINQKKVIQLQNFIK